MAVDAVLKDIESLIAPHEQQVSLDQLFATKLKLADLNYIHVSSLVPNCHEKHKDNWWAFFCLLCEKLLELKAALSNAHEKEQLLSVNQKKHLSACLEMAVTLGIIAHLPKGVGIPLHQRSKYDFTMLKNTTENLRFDSLKLGSLVLIELRKESTFLSLTTSHHLGDLLASLFSLLLPSTWTYKIPEHERDSAKTNLEHIFENTFQPFLFKELMLLNGNKDCPLRLSRAIRGIMTERLMKKGGVISAIRAIIDVIGNASPSQWKTVEVLARLIIHPHIKDLKSYHDSVYPQVLSLVYVKESQFMQIAITCVRLLNETEPDVCEKYFLKNLMLPLRVASSENELTLCLDGLHNCMGVDCSDFQSLPPSVFEAAQTPLFRLYCKVVKSATHIKPKLYDIIQSIFSKCDFNKTFDKFVFGTSQISFAFGENGGVKSLNGDESPLWEETSDILLDLIKSKNDSKLTVKLFNTLIDLMVNGGLEQRLVASKLLAEITTDESVLDSINKNPSGIIKFVISLLEGDYEEEMISLGLMFLGLVLGEKNHQRDWSEFQKLTEPLKFFIAKSKQPQSRVLADEIRSAILTRGATVKESKIDKIKTSFDKALTEAQDALLPVRAHGIKQLCHLVLSKDKETLAKKDIVLCVFKENLKDEDSYVYLAAVEGLSAIATAFPDEVITTLCDQFACSKIPENRLKVGEVLMKVTRLMNEMAVVYKHELINSFLNGCRDDDFLVRASSLSNLGEFCKIVSFRLKNYITEILYCIQCVFETDKFPEPRRASVMVLTSLLKGLGSDALNVLEPVLLELYRKLKIIYEIEKDDITKLHAQLALEEINSCTISFFRQPQTLQKRIYVLDSPP